MAGYDGDTIHRWPNRMRSLRYFMPWAKPGSGLVVLISGVVLSFSVMAREPLELAASFDLERYQGRWYEISRLPNRFQEQCDGEVTAEYTLLDDGRASVTNRCRRADGGWSEARGIARRDATDGREAALEVRFAPRWLSWLPFVWGEYRIMVLDDDYQYALVGSDDREFLWILARQPELPDDVFERLVAEAERQGFDTSGLIRTEQAR